MTDYQLVFAVSLIAITLAFVGACAANYHRMKNHLFAIVEKGGKRAKIHDVVWVVVHLCFVLGAIGLLFIIILICFLYSSPFNVNDDGLAFLVDFPYLSTVVISSKQLKTIILYDLAWFVGWTMFLGVWSWLFVSGRLLLPQERLRKDEEANMEEIDAATFLVGQECPKTSLYMLLRRETHANINDVLNIFVDSIYVSKGAIFPDPKKPGDYYYRRQKQVKR